MMDGSELKMEAAKASGRFATFSVDDLLFGIDVQRVQEVLRPQRMTRVPRAPHVVEGLINLRGQIVTAIDLRRRLRLEPRPAEAAPMNVVIGTEDGAVSLLVDAIGDVIEVDASSYEGAPEHMSAEARELVCGIYKLKSGLLLILDVEQAASAGAGVAG